MRTGEPEKKRERGRINNNARAALYIVLVLSLQILSARFLRAQEISPSFYSEMKWRMIGPFRAGKVNSVAGEPRNHAIYYLGEDGGGGLETTAMRVCCETNFVCHERA